jgi:hypothetical protein
MMRGTRLHGRFELVEPLGAGGVATVWRARDLEAGRDVALKVLHPHLRGERIVCERFRREVGIARSLDHPNVVRAHALYEDEGAISFSMELLEGRTLKEELLARGPLPLAEVRRIAHACLEALGAAHAAGIVHRDFKPQNVLLGRAGEVKLLDFGFARVANAAGLTTRSLVLCTPDYAAPELVQGHPVDGRADLYALGVTLYEVLTGRLPYRGSTPFELLRQHLEAPPPPLRSLRSDVDPRMEGLVQRLLEKAPEGRFATSEAALHALTASLPSSPRPAVTEGVCAACCETRELDWPLCPACGATGERPAAGDWMVVLMRAERNSAEALRDMIQRVGGIPGPDLARASWRTVTGLPRVIIKGVGEPLARLVRERCQARGFQVELRRFSENNSDLLHKANTPSWLFTLGLVVPWMAVLGGCIWAFARSGFAVTHPLRGLWLALPAALGPVGGWFLLRNAHQLLPALARMAEMETTAPLPERLVLKYREALRSVQTPSLRGTVRRLFERLLVLRGTRHTAAPHVQLLLEEPCAAALRLAEQGLVLAQAAQAILERVRLAGEPELWAELESLKARAEHFPAERPALAPLISAKEQALAQVALLEREQVLTTQKLLRVASALELASVHALVAASTASPGGLSMELRQLTEEAEFAAGAAREIAQELQGAERANADMKGDERARSSTLQATGRQ